MKAVDSDALGTVNLALGLSGQGAPLTEFMDGQVNQVLDVASMVRRGRTPAGLSGWYIGILQNVHSGAGTLSTSATPYAQTVGTRATWPNPLPAQFDAWLMGASVRRQSGSGTLTAALFLDVDDSQVGFGVDDSGVAVTIHNSQGLVFWDSQLTENVTMGLKEDGQPYQRIGLRLPRGATLTFTSTASALSTWKAQLILGLFPVGLGQDIVV